MPMFETNEYFPNDRDAASSNELWCPFARKVHLFDDDTLTPAYNRFSGALGTADAGCVGNTCALWVESERTKKGHCGMVVASAKMVTIPGKGFFQTIIEEIK